MFFKAPAQWANRLAAGTNQTRKSTSKGICQIVISSIFPVVEILQTQLTTTAWFSSTA